MHFELRILLFRITFLWNHKSIRGKYALYGLNFLHSRCSNKHSDQNSNFATKTVEEIRFSIYRKLFTLPIAGIISFNWHDVLVVHHQYSIEYYFILRIWILIHRSWHANTILPFQLANNDWSRIPRNQSSTKILLLIHVHRPKFRCVWTTKNWVI